MDKDQIERVRAPGSHLCYRTHTLRSSALGAGGADVHVDTGSSNFWLDGDARPDSELDKKLQYEIKQSENELYGAITRLGDLYRVRTTLRATLGMPHGSEALRMTNPLAALMSSMLQVWSPEEKDGQES